MCDFFGRKKTVMIASVIFAGGAVMMALAPEKYVLIGGRVVVGLGIGISSQSVPIYISESAPAKHRGALVSANVLCITTGQFLSYAVNAGLANLPNQWRWMLGVAAIPAVIQFVGMFFVTESPRFLLMKGKREEALINLTKMRGDSSIAEKECELVSRSLSQKEEKLSLREVFGNRVYVRALVVGCGLQLFQQICAINTVMYYSTNILEKAGFDNKNDVIYLAMLPAGVNSIMTILGMILIDRIGRRKLLLLCFSIFCK